jgi:hypothetical protein
MACFGMLRSMALVRIDVSEERSASIIMVARIGELRTLTVTLGAKYLRNIGSYKSHTA